MGGGRSSTFLVMILLLSACSQVEAGSTPTRSLTTPSAPSSSSSGEVVSSTAPPPPVSTSPGTDDSKLREFIPKRARVHSADGATAFAEFYMAEVARAWMTADGTRLRRLSSPECQSCKNYVSTSESLSSRHEHYASLPAKAFPGIYLPESTPAVAGVQVPVRQLAAKIVASDGSVVKTTRAASGLSEFRIKWTPDGWLILSIVPAVVD